MAGAGDEDADTTPVTEPRTPPQPEKREEAPLVEKQAEPAPNEPETPENNEKPVKAKTLRENYDKLKTENAELQKRIKAIEEERAKPAPEDPEKKKLGETLAQREARLAELEETLRFKDYTASTEYETQYRQPYLKAFADGRATVAGLKLVDAEGNLRQGTDADFDAIMAIQDPDAAAQAMEEVFGTGVKAQMVIAAREKVRDILGRAREAEAEYKKNGGEREKQRSEQFKNHQKEVAAVFDRQAKEAVEKYPKLFKPIEGDEKGNQLLEQGFARADAAFGGVMKDADGKPVKLAPQDLAALHAEIRNKSGGFDRAIHLLAQERARNKELAKKLKEYEDSEPSGGRRNGKTPGQLSSDDQIMNGLLKYAR
jgi:BMFP domain-containing protein YqiC